MSEILAPGRKSIGIVVDANSSLDKRWQAIVARLRQADITAPAQPNRKGTIICNTPKVGIWLMPDNSSSGQLEHFVQQMIPNGDRVWPLAQNYIESIPASDQPRHVTKAQIHAWLAARQRKPQQLGIAISAGAFNVKAPIAKDFVDWMLRLFTSTEPCSVD